jgi:hypothetical protein
MGDHDCLDEAAEGDGGLSFDNDFREAKVAERGLRGKLDDFRPDDSFKEEDEGELDSLILSALEKLHFFDGVRVTGGAESEADRFPKLGLYCCDCL